jgi:hypothetical protein
MAFNVEVVGDSFLCHPNGDFATFEEIATPNYIPCVRFTVRKLFKPLKKSHWQHTNRWPAASYTPINSPQLKINASTFPSSKFTVTHTGVHPSYNNTFQRNIHVSSQTIQTKPRKLQDKWSLDISQDLADLYWLHNKKSKWTFIYNYENNRLYDMRKDGKLVRLKIKKRKFKPLLRKILAKSFKIFENFQKILNTNLSIQPMNTNYNISSNTNFKSA